MGFKQSDYETYDRTFQIYVRKPYTLDRDFQTQVQRSSNIGL